MNLSSTGGARHLRPRNSFLTELPLMLGLVVVWCALWRDFSPAMLLFGFLVAWAITAVFYLPPVRIAGRFNPLWGLWFLVRFIGWVVLGSLEVLWLALRPGPLPRSAVMSTHLRVDDDLLLSTVGGVLSLIPGSLVLEVDRRSGTIYFHVLNADAEHSQRRFQEQARTVEELLILTVGSASLAQAVRTDRLEERRERRRPGGAASEGAISEVEAAAEAAGGNSAGEGTDEREAADRQAADRKGSEREADKPREENP